MAQITFRVRGPGWTETITMAEDKTFGDLEQEIINKRKITNFQLKFGFPPKTIDSTAKGVIVKELNLNNQALTLVPDSSTAEPAVTAPTIQHTPSFKPETVKAEVTDLEWLERDGFIVCRIMPDDNSCMFTALGGALGVESPAFLRGQVAEYILKHPKEYDSVVLEKQPEAYASMIQDPDKWGGAIELSILSDIYDIEICSIDVQSLRVDKYGENKTTRCILVYSGIHYDRIVFTLGLDLPVEFDTTKWTTQDDEVIAKSLELCKKLQDAHYYTDLGGMAWMCTIAGCGSVGQGQKSMKAHMKATGHDKFGEFN